MEFSDEHAQICESCAFKNGEIRLTEIKQSLPIWPLPRQRPAFKDWMRRLKQGEKLPRGRFFRGQKPGRPPLFIDEFWNLMK